ncbi:unnamed protein product, partial [Prorocentrum cordatum]
DRPMAAAEASGSPGGAFLPAVAPAQERLPAWREDGEKAGHRQYILHYRRRAPRSGASASTPRPRAAARWWTRARGRCGTGTSCAASWRSVGTAPAGTRARSRTRARRSPTTPRSTRPSSATTRTAAARTCAASRTGRPSCASGRPRGTPTGPSSATSPRSHRRATGRSTFPPPSSRQRSPRTSTATSCSAPLAAGQRRCPATGSTGTASAPLATENIADCRRGESCAFAHSREEIRVPLLSVGEEEQRPEALTSDFFVYRFKTHWCPVGVQHDWQNCVYAHNYQDARRHPSIGYGPRPCPYWKRQETSLEYSQRCPLGVRCPYSHGAKEQLYHPAYFKTVACQDPPATCPRGTLCAFWHKRSQQRGRATSKEKFNYKAPLTEEQTQANLQLDFLTPPFKLLSAAQELDAWALQPYAFHDAGALEPGSLLPGELGPDGAGTPAARTTAPDSDGASAAPTPGSDAALAAPQDASWSGGMAAQPWVPQMICYVPMPFAGSMLVEGHVAMVGAEDGWLPGAHQQLTLPGPVPGCAAALPQGLAGGRRDDYSDSEDGLSAEKLPGSATETTTDSPRDERMPSLHGFIHFKDAELDSPRAPCRPRANSH